MEHQTLPWALGRSGPSVGMLLATPIAARARITAAAPAHRCTFEEVWTTLAALRAPESTADETSGAPQPAHAEGAGDLTAPSPARPTSILVLDTVPAGPVPDFWSALPPGVRLVVVPEPVTPQEWRDHALARDVALAEVPDPQSIPAWRAEALRLLVEHQGALLRREDDIHALLEQIVLAGGALTELCEALASFFEGSALVTGTDGRVLAQAGVADDLDRVHGLPCFDRSGRLLVEEEALGPRAHGDDRDHRAFVRIVAGGADLGVLGAFAPDRPLSETDLHMLGRAATVAALAVTKEQAVAAVESKYRAEFLRDALAGRAGDSSDAIGHASALGWDLDRRLVVVVAETDENDAESTRSPQEVRALQERFVRAWTWAVRSKDATIAVAGFSQEVVALVPIGPDADSAAVMRIVGDFVRIVRGDGGGGRRSFSTGVSRPIDAADGLPTAYDEALKAVAVGRQMHGPSALTHFDGLGIYRLLALVPDSADLRRFVEESLADLVTDQTPEHEDLLRTLRVLLDTNLNVAETSRLLFFHYNTLRYRIAKLEKLLGPFTTDPQLRLTLALALRVHEMHGI